MSVDRLLVCGSSRWPLSPRRVISRLRSWIRLAEVEAHGSRCSLGRPAKPSSLRGLRLGDNVILMDGYRVECLVTDRGVGRVVIGAGTVANPRLHIGAALEVSIGEECLIASDVFISDHDHDWSDGAIPVIRSRHVIVDPVRIGAGVWIGEGAKILKGVSIGDGCIIGAGAVVSSSLPPRVMAGGVPARALRRWCNSQGEWVRISR